MSHSVPHTSNYYIINENKKEIKYSTTTDSLVHLLFYYITLLSSFLILEDLFFTTHCPNCQCFPSHLPLPLVVSSIRIDYNLLLQMDSSFIAANSLLIFFSTPAHISFLPTYTVTLPYISLAVLY